MHILAAYNPLSFARSLSIHRSLFAFSYTKPSALLWSLVLRNSHRTSFGVCFSWFSRPSDSIQSLSGSPFSILQLSTRTMHHPLVAPHSTFYRRNSRRFTLAYNVRATRCVSSFRRNHRRQSICIDVCCRTSFTLCLASYPYETHHSFLIRKCGMCEELLSPCVSLNPKHFRR